jgi:hypothetical protein
MLCDAEALARRINQFVDGESDYLSFTHDTEQEGTGGILRPMAAIIAGLAALPIIRHFYVRLKGRVRPE